MSIACSVKLVELSFLSDDFRPVVSEYYGQIWIMVEVAKMNHVISANERQWFITGEVRWSANNLLIQGSHPFRIMIMVIQGRLGCRTFPNDMTCDVFICLLQQIMSFARTLGAWLPLGVLPVETSDVRCNFDVGDLCNTVKLSYGFQETRILNSLLIRRLINWRVPSSEI
jgi:hypothetical protein